jgi:hypothetical protein
MSRIDNLYRQLVQAKARRSMIQGTLISFKFKEFQMGTLFSALKQKFMTDFVDKFPEYSNHDLCSCIVSIHIHKSQSCDPCTTKASMVRKFLENARDLMTTEPMWSDARVDEINYCIRMLESNLMIELFAE